jgi:hypothetical protein
MRPQVQFPVPPKNKQKKPLIFQKNVSDKNRKITGMTWKNISGN